MVESTDESEVILDLGKYFAPDNDYVNLEIYYLKVGIICHGRTIEMITRCEICS